MKIYTVCYNTPKFVEYQYRLLKKFIEHDFEYIVYDNTCTNTKNGKIHISTEDIDNKNKLKEICNKHNIKIQDIPENIYGFLMPDNTLYYSNHDVSTRAGISISYATQNIIKSLNKNELCMLIDSDMFPIKNINIEKIMKDSDIKGIQQHREHIEYFTNQLFIFRLQNIDEENIKYLNFMPGKIDNIDIDCGADLYYLTKNISHLNKKYFKNVLFSEPKYIHKNENKYILEYCERDLKIVRKTHRQDIGYHSEVYDGVFLHFRAGSNWRDGMKYSERTLNLFNLLDTCLN